jgi:hypothetical protein
VVPRAPESGREERRAGPRAADDALAVLSEIRPGMRGAAFGVLIESETVVARALEGL